jgi:hypothetical protein
LIKKPASDKIVPEALNEKIGKKIAGVFKK